MLKQNVLIVLTNKFPYANGEPYLYNELPFLLDSFDKVIFFAVNPSDSLIADMDKRIKLIKKPDEVKKTNFSFTSLIILLKELPHIIKLPNPFYFIRYYYAFLLDKERQSSHIVNEVNMRSLIANGNVIVYSYWFNELAIIGSFIKQIFPDVKTVSRAHGFDLFEEQNKNNYIPFRAFQFNYIDKIFSVSKKGESYLKLKTSANKADIYTSYLGTNTVEPQVYSGNSIFSIATCSIIRNIKRLHLMVDILQNIKFDLVWHVIGNGPDENNLKIVCKKLPSNIKVIFHGYLTPPELSNFYNTNFINLFCSLSSSEGLPVSMMEAISYGIPIMSTDVGGCNEICNQQTGFLIDKNFDALEAANEIEIFKNSNANTFEFRRNVRVFWEEHFYSKTNYSRFVSEIIA